MCCIIIYLTLWFSSQFAASFTWIWNSHILLLNVHLVRRVADNLTQYSFNCLQHLQVWTVLITKFCYVLFFIIYCCNKLLWFKVALQIQLHFRYSRRPVMSVPGLYDPTTIMNADILSYCMKEGWFKLVFYLVSFFYYLYRLERKYLKHIFVFMILA